MTTQRLAPGTPPAEPPGQGHDGWARWGWVVPGVWLLFLGFTVMAVVEADLGPLLTAVGIGLVVAFAVVYLAGFHLHMGGRLLRPLAFPGWRWAGLAAMCLIIGCLWAVIGPLTLNVGAFVVVYCCYLFETRVALALSGGAVVAVALVAWLGDAGPLWFIVVIMVGVLLFSIVMSTLIATGEREEVTRRDLALASERERVARDVHDGLGHTLTVVALKAELAERVLDSDPQRARAELAELRRLIRDALGQVRVTVGGLRGNDLPTLAAAFEMTLTGAGLDVEIQGDPAALDADPDLRQALGWVLQEAVTNVLRHSRGTACRIGFMPTSLTVTDDGVGLGDAPAGHGLTGMAERLDAVGATLTVGPGEGSGTRVEVTW